MYWIIAFVVLVVVCYAAWEYAVRQNAYEMYHRYKMIIKFEKNPNDAEYWYDRWVDEGGMRHRRYCEKRWNKWDNF